MKEDDIKKNTLMTKDLILNEWVVKGENVRVDVYMDEKTNNCFQLQTNGDKSRFRQTGPCEPYEVKNYGAWEKVL